MATLITVGGSSSTGNGYTFNDLIEKVYRRVMGGVREMSVVLVGNGTTTTVSATDSTVQVSGQQSSMIQPGTVLSVELELMLVLSFNQSTGVATVERGYWGSVASQHVSPSATQPIIVYLNPRYSRYDIGVAINDDLRSLSSPTNGLFRVGVAQLTYNPVFQGYDLGDLPDNFIDILEVRYRIAPPYRTFPAIKSWKVVRWQQNSTDPVFPSGKGIILREAGWPGLPVYVTYSAPFLRFVDTSDNLLNTPVTNDEAPPYNGYTMSAAVNFTATATNGSNTLTSVSSLTGLFPGQVISDGAGVFPFATTIKAINTITNQIQLSNTATANSSGDSFQAANPTTVPNLTATMIDLPPLGAEIDLTLPREISRNFMESQPDPRKAQEVAPGAIAGSVNALVNRRMQRISEEADRLQRQYTKVRGW